MSAGPWHRKLTFANSRLQFVIVAKLNEEIERKSPKRLLVKFNAFENDCLKIHSPTNEMQIKLNEISKIELKTNNHPR